MTPKPGDGWEEWSNYVLKLLEDHDKKLDQLIIDVAKLKVKAGIWGFAGGAGAIVIGLGIWMLKSL